MFQFRYLGSISEQLESFLLDYYQHRDLPSLIAIDDDPKPFSLLNKIINERSKSKIEIREPKRGELKCGLFTVTDN